MAKRILVLSFYYQPDLSAGSFRTSALVNALVAASPELDVDVVTTLPNRYKTFSSAAPQVEHRNRCTVHRVPLPAHRSGMVDQALALLVFWWGALRIASRMRYDVVYATSSRLMTAVLGAAIAVRQRAPLYLDVRDLFVDNIRHILPGAVVRVLRPAFSRMERFAFGRASRINLVSRGFESYIRARYPDVPLSFHTNGIDDEFLAARAAMAVPRDGKPIVVLYAGNIGEGQGLNHILPELAKRLQGRVQFQVIGDGGRRRQLDAALASSGVRNVSISNPVPRQQLIERYAAADVLFLHLNDYEAFERVLPSKVFEYAALGKPIWAGVSGHSAAFLKAEVPNTAVFPPCDVPAAIRAFDELRIEHTPRDAFVERYSRAAIMQAMARDILATSRL